MKVSLYPDILHADVLGDSLLRVSDSFEGSKSDIFKI